MAEVDQLLVSIAADTKNFVAGLGRAEAALTKFGKATEAASARISTVIGTALGAAAVHRLAAFSAASVQATARIGEMAERAGLSAEQFQALAGALRESGANQEQLSQASAKLATNLTDLQRGT